MSILIFALVVLISVLAGMFLQTVIKLKPLHLGSAATITSGIYLAISYGLI